MPLAQTHESKESWNEIHFVVADKTGSGDSARGVGDSVLDLIYPLRGTMNGARFIAMPIEIDLHIRVEWRV